MSCTGAHRDAAGWHRCCSPQPHRLPDSALKSGRLLCGMAQATAHVCGPPKELPELPCHGQTGGHISLSRLFLAGWSGSSVGDDQTGSHPPLRSGYQTRGDAVAGWPYLSHSQNYSHCLQLRGISPDCFSCPCWSCASSKDSWMNRSVTCVF